MKRNLIFTALFALLNLFSTEIFAQKTAVWIGGQAGRESDWDCPENWSGNRVPNEFSDVVLPDISSQSRALPVIKTGFVQINSLSVDASTVLLVADGARLLVFGWCQAENPASIRATGHFRVLDEISAVSGAVAKN